MQNRHRHLMGAQEIGPPVTKYDYIRDFFNTRLGGPHWHFPERFACAVLLRSELRWGSTNDPVLGLVSPQVCHTTAAASFEPQVAFASSCVLKQ